MSMMSMHGRYIFHLLMLMLLNMFISECTVLGDPRGVPKPMFNFVANGTFTLFTTMMFVKKGHVERLDYFALREGPVFVSFWYRTDNQHVVGMRGKISVDLQKGYQVIYSILYLNV